jgi:DNA polymerase elongation subunit (family B)
MKYDLASMSIEELEALDAQLTNEIIAQDNRQKAVKIDMNSLYGILGNRYSRWCNYDLALAVTSCGQAVIFYTGYYVNQKLSEFGFGNTLFYIDTDSIYLSLDEIVKEFFGGKEPEDYSKVVDFMDNFCEKVIQPIIDEALVNVAQIFQAGERQMENHYLQMKREIIASSMFQKAKKKYCALVHDSEGFRYEKPKKKIMGLDIIRRETPQFVKDQMDTALDMILRDEEDLLANHNKGLRELFYQEQLENVCPIKPANNLRKWYTQDGSIKSKTPAHVSASLRYNKMIHDIGLESKYDEIKEGEKVFVAYLHEPNPAGLKYIAWPINSVLPEEFGLKRYIDWKTLFDKTYMKKVKDFTEVLGWRYSEKKKLSSFFSIRGG